MSLIATGPKTLIQLASVVGMCSWCAYQLSFGNVWALPLVGRENQAGTKAGHGNVAFHADIQRVNWARGTNQ